MIIFLKTPPKYKYVWNLQHVSIYSMSLIVTASADANYIPYIDGLVYSMLHHHPNYKFLIRFINCDSSIIKEYKNRGIQVISDTCDLDMKKNLVKDSNLNQFEKISCNPSEFQARFQGQFFRHRQGTNSHKRAAPQELRVSKET